MTNRKAPRIRKYRLLKEAGFTSKQSTKMKDLKDWKVQYACTAKKIADGDLKDDLEKSIGVKL